MINCNSFLRYYRIGFRYLMMIFILPLWGCSDSDNGGQISKRTNDADSAKEATKDSAKDSVSPNSRAFEMMHAGEEYDKYMAVQMKAVEQLRDGKPQSDAIEILSQTGHFLMRQGHYIDALEYIQEASDSAKVRMEKGHADAGMARMYTNLSGLYSRFGLFEDALQESDLAIKTSALNDDLYAPDIWRMRGAIYSMMIAGAENKEAIADSVLYCLRRSAGYIPKADKDIRQMLYDKCKFDRAALFVENPELFADSIGKAITLLRDIDAKGSFAVSKDVLEGRALTLTGQNEDGIRLMESGLEEFRKQGWKESEEWSLQLLAQSYAAAGQGQKLAGIYPEVNSIRDSMLNQTKLNTLIGADFKYRLREKQRQVESLKEENSRSGKVIILGSVLLILGLLAGAVLAVIYIKLRSKAKREKIEHKREISDILTHQVSLNNKIEQLNEELEKKENDHVIDNAVGQLNPALLSGEDETKFRRAFVSLHPHFLKNLRRNYPELTSSDELLCMLIYLKVPSIDMAASLGISRASLNSARYRLRKRLNLDKGADLDLFIQSLWGG